MGARSATSEHLLHWSELGVALAPGDGDDGVWSGSIAVPGDPTPAALFYTSVSLDNVQVGRVRIARPTDGTWETWVKGDVVAELPADVDAVAFRDPWVFHDGARWRMVLGAGLADGTAAGLTYRSEDLEAWEEDGILAARHRDETEPLWTGSGWECPQVFRLGDSWVLTMSVWEPSELHYQAWGVGDLVDGRFTARSWGRLSYGPSYYAGSAFADHDGARGLIYWLRGVEDPAGRWAGAHSLPHILRLVGDRVVAEPHANVAAARAGESASVRDGELEFALQSDVVVTLDHPGASAELAIGVVHIQADAEELTVAAERGSWTMPVGGRVTHVVVDGPVVEIFTTGGTMGVPVPLADPVPVAVPDSGPGADATHTVRASGAASLEAWALA